MKTVIKWMANIACAALIMAAFLVAATDPEYNAVLEENYDEVAAAFGWETYPDVYESGFFVPN